MRLLLLCSLGALFTLPCQSVRAAPLTDPAAALPEHTIVYAEIHDPGKLLAEFDSLFKGSALDNMPASLVRFEQRHGQQPVTFGPPKEALGALGLLLSPEVRREMQRFGGAAVGLTGLTRNGKPEFVAIIVPGRSTLPGMAFRSAVTMMPTVVAGNVDGVVLYRQARDHSDLAPVFARTSTAILIGSQNAVTQALHRIQGKAEGKALADMEMFRQARSQAGNDPGLFGYLNVPELGDILTRSMVGRQREAHQALVQQLVKPAAFRYEALSLTLANGTLRYRQFVALNPKEQSPLLAILPNRPANIDLLHFAPKDALFAGVLSNADGQKRWSAGVKLIDAIAQAQGQAEHLPSEHLKQGEAALDIDIGKDVLGRIANLGIALANPFPAGRQRQPRAGHAPPFLFFIQGNSADDAKKLIEEVAPKILNAISHGEAGEPVSETVSGRSLHRIKIDRQEVHYGQDGAVIVIGMDGRTVATALTAGAKKQGYLADNQIRNAVAKYSHSFALLVGRPGVASMLLYGVATPQTPPAIESRPDLRRLSPPPQKARRPGEPDIVRIAQIRGPGDNEGPRELQQALQLFHQLGPLVVSWNRMPDHLMLAVEQPGLKPGVARLTNWLLELYLKDEAGARPRRRGGFPAQTPLPTQPPAPPPALRR